MTTDEPPRPGRGRPRKHPSWTDNLGIKHAFTSHPSYSVCRNFQDRSWDPDGLVFHQSGGRYELCDRWRDDLVRFVYELTAEIGSRPGPYSQIRARDESEPVGPGNACWVDPHPQTRRARWGRIRQAGRTVATSTPGFVIPEAVAVSLRHDGGCESQWIEPIDCLCCAAAVECAEFYDADATDAG